MNPPYLTRDSEGNYWQLMTRHGRDDPGGTSGVVHTELGGSGCRWYPYPVTAQDEQRMISGEFVLDFRP